MRAGARESRRAAGRRRAGSALAGAAIALAGLGWGVSGRTAEDADPDRAPAPSAPLSFAFLSEPPGRLVRVADARLHLDCDPGALEPGADAPGAPVVLFDSGLGGSALEWLPVRERLVGRAPSCAYDRAGYGWSDPSARPRDAAGLARELDALLEAAGVRRPVILVAHSFGGFVARLLADARPGTVAALVLVDASHEQQFARLEAAGGRRMLPRGRQFVISTNRAPENLPEEIRRKVAAFARMRKTYSATHGEMASFRDSAAQVERARARRDAPFPVPVTVIRRGARLYPEDAPGRLKNDGWIALQEDLAALGTPGRAVVADGAGHHVHVDAPALVAREILALVEALGAGREAGPGGPVGERP